MQNVGRIANGVREARRTDTGGLAVVRSAAEARQAERIVADAGQRMRGIGGLRVRRRRRAEAAGKPSPGDALFIEQVADILACQLDREFASGRATLVVTAIIEVRIQVG